MFIQNLELFFGVCFWFFLNDRLKKIDYHLQGSGVSSSQVVQGMVFKREVEGNIGKVENAKIAVFSCPLDSMGTETKVRSSDYVLC